MIIQDILMAKGNKIVHVLPGTTIRKAVSEMVENKIGAVLIIDSQKRPIGIFTERDNLRTTQDAKLDPSTTLVDDYMTRDLVVGTPSDNLEESMSLMTERRVRHLPVVSDGLLVGLVSIGDVMKAMVKKHEFEIKYLKDYIMS